MAVAAPPIIETPIARLPDVVGRLREKFGEAMSAVYEFRGETTITVTRDALVDVARFLRDEFHFEELVDVTALDWDISAKDAPVRYAETLQGGEERELIESRPRFEVLFSFLSISNQARLRLRVPLGESDTRVPSLTSEYAGANFFEREVFDLMGISFVGHPFMHRILMPDNWVGYPLRKDNPLGYEPVDDAERFR